MSIASRVGATFSYSENLCEAGMSSDGFVVPEDERVAQQQQQQQQQQVPSSCLTDANVGSMCCSAGGYCGHGDSYCGEGMQEEYSNSKNLCEEGVAPQGSRPWDSRPVSNHPNRTAFHYSGAGGYVLGGGGRANLQG